MKKLEENTELHCINCNEKFTALQIDTYTYSKCNSRTLRREFTSIIKESLSNRKKGRYYCCPYCDKFELASSYTRNLK